MQFSKNLDCITLVPSIDRQYFIKVSSQSIYLLMVRGSLNYNLCK